ncbi:MAG: hypothetical protein CW335_02255 [Clostridiales bacterium]|nr:hypothetical protein [Clostridiales bacterium]
MTEFYHFSSSFFDLLRNSDVNKFVFYLLFSNHSAIRRSFLLLCCRIMSLFYIFLKFFPEMIALLFLLCYNHSIIL